MNFIILCCSLPPDYKLEGGAGDPSCGRGGAERAGYQAECGKLEQYKQPLRPLQCTAPVKQEYPG